MMTPEGLQNHMAYCTGTEFYYGTLWGFNYTDGVKEFAQKAEAYWFIDEVGVFLTKNPNFRSEFLSITLKVTGNKADILFKRDTHDVVYKKHIAFTDCPEGTWEFFYTDKVLLWNSEY